MTEKRKGKGCGEEPFGEYRGSKVRRLDLEVTKGGGVPLAAASLSLRTNFEALLRAIATIGVGARGVAREYLSDHLFQVMDGLIALAVQKKDRAAARWAAQILSMLSQRCIGAVIDIAESDGEGRESAGESLAFVLDALSKHLGKLEANSAFGEALKRIKELKRRRDIVANPRPIGQIVQKELALAELYRERLRFYRHLFGDAWLSEIRTEIPREYFAFEPLPAFCKKSYAAWWQLLWPLIQKNNPSVLEKLRALAKRKEVIWTHLDGVSKRQVKGRKLFWNAFYTQSRNHLKALAKAREYAGR